MNSNINNTQKFTLRTWYVTSSRRCKIRCWLYEVTTYTQSFRAIT